MGDFIKTERLKLPGTTASPNEAENIFKEIEDSTGTRILFEAGHFSSTFKKDPIIRLCGLPEAVKRAKNMVLESLELQSNRIILKMDITHQEHPSLIGKKGHLIKKVMKSTDCHIHFPDTNKIAANTKSNQVSIAGEPMNVERARVMLRALIPFQIMFDVDTSNGQGINIALPIWKQMEQLGLDICFTKNKKCISIRIRCCQGLFSSLRQQILGFIEQLSGKRGSDLPPVNVFMDIMPQHHDFVKGHEGSNIQTIAKKTGVEITFGNLNSDASKLRLVKITGNLDCVYMAWQEIMNVLPISVSFDVSGNRNIKSDEMKFLIDCNIYIYSRPKPRYCIQSITVKGPEKHSRQLIQCRQNILGLPVIKFQPDINDINTAMNFQNCCTEIRNSQVLFNLSSSVLHDRTSFLNINNNFQSVENSIPNFVPSFSPVTYADVYNFENVKGDTVYSSSMGSSVYSSSEFNSWGQMAAYPNNDNEDVEQKVLLDLSDKVRKTCTNSDNFLAQNSLKSEGVDEYELFEKKLSAHQAIHRNIESTQVPSNLWAGYGFSQSMPASYINKSTEPSNRYSCTSLESNNSSSSDDSWDFFLPDYIENKIWSDHGENILSMSNVFDFKMNTSSGMQFGSEDILPRLLYQEGLQNHIDTFLREEIDYAAFLLLNESDLLKLGINYQARMKITCLIRELQDQEGKKSFDAAPGAERKMRQK